VSVTPEIERVQFQQTYACGYFLSGETRELWYIKVDAGYTAFVERIACDWFGGVNPPATGSIVKLIIDGFPRTFVYQIDLNKPYVFDPPIVAKHFVRWVITNNDVPGIVNGKQLDGSHYFGVLTDGFFAKPKS
jgi:hypothetical protein